MSDLSIEKGVPIPKREGWSKYSKTIREMEVGDSVFVTQQKEACNFHTTSYRLNVRMSSRKVDGGWRVWRVK